MLNNFLSLLYLFFSKSKLLLFFKNECFIYFFSPSEEFSPAFLGPISSIYSLIIIFDDDFFIILVPSPFFKNGYSYRGVVVSI